MPPDLAEIIRQFGSRFIDKHHPNSYQLRTLDALEKCRTAALGGHKYRCDTCGKEHLCYNSCRNRHCPRCQGSEQAFWVEDRIEKALPLKHYHLVFTLPESLNIICQLDSRWFYSHLFATVWDTLKTFGYSHYGVESGAICVLHTWGQNLCLHPHLHCLVPAAGLSLSGKLKFISKGGKYLYPVRMLSAAFKGMFMAGLKKHLRQTEQLTEYNSILEQASKKPWVVNCQPALGKPQQVIGYLGQYIHRVAITNQRILRIGEQRVTFRMKDYRDHATCKPITLDGVEFLRRFCLHILPHRFVKIRYFGIYSSRFRSTLLPQDLKLVKKAPETTIERIKRLSGKNPLQCPVCKKGKMVAIETLPRIRAPDNFLFASQNKD
jgi:hypothetical protein